MRWLLLLVLTGVLGMLPAGGHARPWPDSPHRELQSVETAPPVLTPPRAQEVPDLHSRSVAEWWGRAKRALHHLSGCALASAGITYALIAGVAFPGAAILGLAGAGVVVLMCL